MGNLSWGTGSETSKTIKHEIRISKSETNSKSEYQITEILLAVMPYKFETWKISFVLNLGFVTFVFVSNFVLRISNFAKNKISKI